MYGVAVHPRFPKLLHHSTTGSVHFGILPYRELGHDSAVKGSETCHDEMATNLDDGCESSAVRALSSSNEGLVQKLIRISGKSRNTTAPR